MATKSKNEKAIEPVKLEIVPAVPAPGQIDLTKTIYGMVLAKPTEGKKIKRLTLPPLLKPGEIPVGQTVSGKLHAVVKNFTGRDDMRESKCLHLIHESGTEFMLPYTGAIKRAIPEIEKAVGESYFFKRLPDGMSAKYKKPQFIFEVWQEV